MKRHNENKYAMNRYIEDVGYCELCGSRKGLECHHIIPLSTESYGVDLDNEDNYLCVCFKCHSLLTPRKLLTKIGIEKARFGGDLAKNIAYDFYVALGKRIDEDPYFVGFSDVCDVFDSVMNNYGAMKGEQHGENAV